MERRPIGSIEASHIARYRFAAARVSGKILDAACGVGYGSDILTQAGCDVTGVDISSDAIQQARHNFQGTFIQGDIRERPWTGKFDAIVSFETIEHIRSPEMVLHNFADSLKEGGFLLCSVPNEQLYPFRAETFANDEYPHIRHYTPDEFEHLLGRGGFKVALRYCNSKQAPQVREGTEDRFLVYVCQLLSER